MVLYSTLIIQLNVYTQLNNYDNAFIKNNKTKNKQLKYKNNLKLRALNLKHMRGIK